jgi:hypothetical protein
MNRSHKIQELIIQMALIYYANYSLQSLYLRPTPNWLLGLFGLILIVLAFFVHAANSWFGDKYFQPQKLAQVEVLYRYFYKFIFLLVVLFFVGFLFKQFRFFIFAFVFLWPLILAYPVRYFWRHQWYPRALLLVGIVFIAYAQFAFTKNDRLHLQLKNTPADSYSFLPQIIAQFDKESLTPQQANDVAWLLITHPDETFRDYKKAAEFSKVGLRRESHPDNARNLADTLACAYMGQQKKEQAQAIIEKYNLKARQSLLDNNELCESTVRRSPASIKSRKKYKYYF